MPDKAQITTIKQALARTKQQLQSQKNKQGFWVGRLSDSAVSTAVASMALSLQLEDRPHVIKAVSWLCRDLNDDGGWGDTPQSPSNMSATLLARSAIINSNIKSEQALDCLQKSDAWLQTNLSAGCEAKMLINQVLNFYGKDLTFSVPILSVCALCGAIPDLQTNWKKIPSLPFELSLLPDRLFSALRLPVVSYAIPALIAVGIAQHKHGTQASSLIFNLRKKAVRPALKKLEKLIPESGGFLEAAPLTGFVAFCLGRSGYGKHAAVSKGLEFLRRTVRESGSWPIDTNLSTWVTSLAAKALTDDLNKEERTALINYYAQNQQKGHHPFTNARPGGWSWTNLSGGVPDADDTSGALNALATLIDGQADRMVINGLQWLLDLMNNDGGIPTFSRGWGFLPFDRSCPDISAHALSAFQAWQNRVDAPMRQQLQQASDRIISYLARNRDSNQVWHPLWFGDQNAARNDNPVYGTSIVIEALCKSQIAAATPLIEPAINWLITAQNADGGWGGNTGAPSQLETTAKAVTALSLAKPDHAATTRGALYIANQLNKFDGNPPSSPFGLYFSSLWYDEKLYPAVFAIHALNTFLKQYDK